MTLLEILDKDLIKVPLSGTTKDEIISELVELSAKSGSMTNKDAALTDILNREALGSTGLERGIAIPHAKTTGVTKTILAIGVKPDGVDFQSLDGNPAKLFFMIMAPPDQSGAHIEILSEIAKATQSAAFCRVMEAARSSDEVMELFQEE